MLFIQASFANTACADIRNFQVTGIGHGSHASGLHAALVDALTNAVTQVNGAFIAEQTELHDVIRTTIVDNQFTFESSENLYRRISMTTAGYIESFQVLERTDLHGLVELLVQVQVCADARILVVISGDEVASGVARAELKRFFDDMNWVMVEARARIPAAGPALFLETGASHVLEIELFITNTGTYRDLTLAQIELAATLHDNSRKSTVIASAQHAEGLANTLDGAIRDGTQKATSLLRGVLGNALSGSIAHHITLSISNAKLRNTRFEIEALLERIPEALTLTSINHDADEFTLVITLSSTKDACWIAGEMAQSRQLLLQLDSCNSRHADIRVLRE